MHIHDSYSNFEKKCHVPYSLKLHALLVADHLQKRHELHFSRLCNIEMIIFPPAHQSLHSLFRLNFFLCHFNAKERLTFLCSSDCFRNSWVSVDVFPMPAQNFIAARCSSFWALYKFVAKENYSVCLQIECWVIVGDNSNGISKKSNHVRMSLKIEAHQHVALEIN